MKQAAVGRFVGLVASAVLLVTCGKVASHRSRPGGSGGASSPSSDAGGAAFAGGDAEAGAGGALSEDAVSKRPSWAAWPLLNGDPSNTRRSSSVGPRAPIDRVTLDVAAPKALVIGVDDALYVSSSDDASVHAVEPSTGKSRWVFRPPRNVPAEGPELYPTYSPSLAAGPEGNLYVGYQQGAFYALNADGSVRWQFTTGKQDSLAGDASQFGLPMVGDEGRVYVSEAGDIHAFESDGTPLWQFHTPSMQAAAVVGVAADGTVYAEAEHDALFALRRDGTLRWRWPASEADQSFTLSVPSIADDGSLFVVLWDRLAASRSYLAKLDPDGNLQQRPSFPTIQNLVVADNGAYFSADAQGVLRVDAKARVKWRFANRGNASIVDAEGAVYSASTAGIDAVDASGKLLWELPTFAINPHSIAAPDILALGADGTLYSWFGDAIHGIGGGAGCEGAPVDCDDSDACTSDRCDAALGCVHEPKCTANGACTTASCNSDGSCVFTSAPDGLACDAGIACNQGQVCSGGQCTEAASSCSIAAAGWPLFGHDAQRSFATQLLGPSGPNFKWPAGIPSVTSFAIADDGEIYAAGDGKLRKITPDGLAVPFAVSDASELALRQDGGLLAQISPGGALTSLDAQGVPAWTFDAAPLGSPAFGPSGAIYAASRFSLLALRPDGSLFWSLATGGSEAQDSSAVVAADGTLYALTPELTAIDPAGRIKWKQWLGWVRSLAIGRAGDIYVVLDDGVRAVDSTGADLWSYTPSTSSPDSRRLVLGVAPSGDVIVTTGTTIDRLEALTGSLRATFSLPADGMFRNRFDAAAPPVIDGNDTVFAVATATDNSFNPQTQATLYALEPSATVAWSASFDPERTVSTGRLAIGPDRTLYLTLSGTLLAIGP